MRKDWEIKKLGEVCEFINRGISPKYIEQNGLVVLNQKCVRNHKINFDVSRMHDSKAKKVNQDRLIQVGDVLVNSTGTGTLGRVAQVKEKVEATIDSHITIVRPKRNIFYDEFFGYAMTSIEEEISKGGDGCGGQTELSRTKLKEDYCINYPKSLSEQKRIVEILDKAFAAIDNAKTNIEKNLQNAKELFESYLQNVFANKGEDWEEKKLGDERILEIVDGDRGVNYPNKKEFHESEYCVFMNTGNVRPNGFDFSEVTFITKEKDDKLRKGKLKRNDVVMTTRGTIGNIGLYNDDVPFENVRINSGMLIFKPNIKFLYPNYLFEVFRSGKIKEQIRKYVSGAAQPQLPIRTLIKFSFPLPKSIEEQKEIVKKLSDVSIKTNKLNTLYQQKLDNLEELKKSILQKAFNGELTTATKNLVT